MSVLVLVVDDEPDVEALFRQQFRRDLRAQRFIMDFANSAADALVRIAGTIEQSLILILSDINMPGMTGLEMLPRVKEIRPDVPVIMITAYGDPDTKRKAENGSGFEPSVIASTRDRGEHVEIRIRDNGTGIPPDVMEKMFNPFFTTKPAGEGTGLGLSMSHDIIVKQHGGTIDVATRPGEFTEFTIVLPRTSNLSNKSRG